MVVEIMIVNLIPDQAIPCAVMSINRDKDDK